MGDTDMSSAIKKVCRKRVSECTHPLDPRAHVVLGSDESSVESVSTGSISEDSMVPITPTSKCEGVDHCPSPLGTPNPGLLHCDYKRKADGFLEGECDSLSKLSYSNQQLLGCDSRLKDGGSCSEDNLCTPKKDVFDPFAPGPEKLNLAPYRRKYTKELNISVVRKLKFDLCTKFAPKNGDLTVSEEEMLVQSVYSDIMETIISTQTKEIGKVACELPLPDDCRTPIDATEENVKVSCELPLSDGCRTPVGATRLSGVADTCPGAPVKARSPRKFRRIDKTKCRKLDF